MCVCVCSGAGWHAPSNFSIRAHHPCLSPPNTCMFAYGQKPESSAFERIPSVFERRGSSDRDRVMPTVCSPIGERAIRLPSRYAAVHPTHLLVFNLNHFTALAESLEVLSVSVSVVPCPLTGALWRAIFHVNDLRSYAPHPWMVELLDVRVRPLTRFKCRTLTL